MAVVISDSSPLICKRAGVLAFTVRRETGKEWVVRVHHDEDVASHVGPEPCAVIREDGCEASAGERAGQPLSRERKVYPGCRRRGNWRKATQQARQRERCVDPAWS